MLSNNLSLKQRSSIKREVRIVRLTNESHARLFSGEGGPENRV